MAGDVRSEEVGVEEKIYESPEIRCHAEEMLFITHLKGCGKGEKHTVAT